MTKSNRHLHQDTVPHSSRRNLEDILDIPVPESDWESFFQEPEYLEPEYLEEDFSRVIGNEDNLPF